MNLQKKRSDEPLFKAKVLSFLTRCNKATLDECAVHFGLDPKYIDKWETLVNLLIERGRLSPTKFGRLYSFAQQKVSLLHDLVDYLVDHALRNDVDLEMDDSDDGKRISDKEQINSVTVDKLFDLLLHDLECKFPYESNDRENAFNRLFEAQCYLKRLEGSL